jgi:drug/metabolite transporter (DMT)-like permease
VIALDYNFRMANNKIIPRSHQSTSPTLLTLTTILLWSFGSLVARLVAMQSAFVLLSISFLFSFATIIGYLLFTRQISLSWFKHIPLMHLFIAPLGYFVYSVAINQSSRAFDSISETTLLNNTWPIFTVLFSEILSSQVKSKWTRILETAGILLGFFSLITLVTGGNFNSIQLNLPGVLWGLLAGVSYGFFSAYSGTLTEVEQKRFLLVAITISLLLILPFTAFEVGKIAPLTVIDLLAAFTMGALLDGVGYILWTRAIRISRERESRIAAIASLMFLLPFLNLIWVRLFLKETQFTQSHFLISLTLLVISNLVIQTAPWCANLFQRKSRA